MRVLVVGGGVAGTATALALRRYGIPSTVFEAYGAGGDDAGAFLTVMAGGMSALASIDAADAVVAVSYPAAAVETFTADGTHLKHGDIAGPARTLSRAALYRALQELAVEREIEIAHGRRMVDATRTGGGGVEVRFADGSRRDGDLLVGADGIHSLTRRLIDPQAPSPRYTGQHVVYGYADGQPVPSAPDAYHMVFGSRAFFGFTAPGDGRTWWFTRINGESRPAGTTPAQWRDLALAAARVDDGPAAAIIGATGEHVVGGDSYDIPTTPHWHDDRMVLVGDAAHAASPAAAQGASMAVQDAVALAEALHEQAEPAAAFAAYAARRRPPAEETVAASARLTDRGEPR
ncbi:FAD-dependent oxidoreductase [Virgisporangium aliadipatigenens]|uniref:FAD-dependent oxidoreductase n=1 Tax=Virgisporangium aliadipatigenens TaxID=741659 RepID=A0A8J3YIP2_9ACTN|nr:FAD-dependent monooxygenase [Virgisporangium aliadipatigenens]GIJ46009.1 FAD-dependent oxidoreductase [Virgisporangium aliadipatigenens]